MKLNTNSNTYILVYSSVLVVIVAFLLATVYQSLKPAQDTNVALDKKKQILCSLNIRDIDNEEAEKKYKEIVTADEIMDESGTVVNPGTAGGEDAGFKLGGSDYKAGRLALFVCSVDGEKKYVIPVYGMGLWGGISGYISTNDDRENIYGVYFNHEGAPAGLSAELKDNRQWQEQFCGKKLFSSDTDSKVALSVVKKVEDQTTQVDAVTGATLTSNGVSDMLHEGLGKYIKFLKDK